MTPGAGMDSTRTASQGAAVSAVRAAVLDDARAIAEAHVAGWQSAYRGIVPAAVLDALSVESRATQWRDRLADREPTERRLWVVEHDAGVRGFAATAPARDRDADPAITSELMAIYLRPDSWGRGLGLALLTHAIDDLGARGWAALSLWVFEANLRARRFYERAGFAIDAGRKSETYGGTLLPALRYRRALRRPSRT